MRTALSLAFAFALPGVAITEDLSCTVKTDCSGGQGCEAEVIKIAFAIDRRQFAPALNPAEPPRVKRTLVTAGDATFAAEPFVIADTRGFWADAEALGSRILTVTADGEATYTDTHTGRTMTGRCEETG